MTGYVQKVTARGPGPLHLDRPGGLTLCGRRLRGFGVRYPQAPEFAEPLCPACVKHLNAGTRGAWRSR